MDYKSVLNEIKSKGIKRVFVTGAQRSGTRFAANVLAKDLNIKLIDEVDFGINNFEKFTNLTKGMDAYCVQAPALSHHIEKLPEDVAIVFMYRPFKEIFASQKRINWQASEHEPTYKGFYKKVYNKEQVSWGKSLAEVKREIWEKYQAKRIKNTHFNLQYSSLKVHPMWIDKKNRKNFKANQIK